jgi:alpha-tubulin suppressor-like RCC1 family protein
VGVDDATDVSIGFGHACAVRETGAIACWGNNDRYQLGDGTRDVRYAPVTVLGL